MEGKESFKWDASALKELDDSEIQKKIDYEVRMRDGTVRLLSACHEEAQALEASKNLHTINSRILALMGLLQRHRAKSVTKRVRRRESSSTTDEEEETVLEPCKARVSLSDIRIPLMWSQDDHQKAKTEQHIYYVFCLLKMDNQVLDTSMVETDESETDITFDDVIVFKNVSPDFKLELEIYYTVSSETAANRNSHTKKFTKSKSTEAMKFVLAGHTHLNVDHLDDKIKTYDLKTGLVGASFSATTASTEEVHAPQLALWGQVCCRLAAKPDCLGVDKMKGFLDVQCLNNGRHTWSKLWCILRNSSIVCWHKEDDVDVCPPVETIDIKMNMQIKDSVTPTLKDKHIIILASKTHDKEPVISTETEEECIKWKKALHGAIFNVTSWKQACTTSMKIENPSRKIFLQPQKLYDSVDVVLSPLAEEPENNPPQQHPAGHDEGGTGTTDAKCTYDIWQRRKPEDSSEKKNKNGHNGLEFEA
ncbi:rhotekin isoform X2 [Exaiptasia diaphana]|uniref:PH domain-containing protein n=1 Tax=Exaiptasia diaphana TaxID=2652724 RepID=A0A913Y1Q5_EXADI|nr:rhotekin isoform X2 [Exaiptasia diaphana]KXJ23519.1 Rhotekin [Exaiptasia diaphana]